MSEEMKTGDNRDAICGQTIDIYQTSRNRMWRSWFMGHVIVMWMGIKKYLGRKVNGFSRPNSDEVSGHLGRYEMKNLKSYLPPVDKSVSA